MQDKETKTKFKRNLSLRREKTRSNVNVFRAFLNYVQSFPVLVEAFLLNKFPIACVQPSLIFQCFGLRHNKTISARAYDVRIFKREKPTWI